LCTRCHRKGRVVRPQTITKQRLHITPILLHKMNKLWRNFCDNGIDQNVMSSKQLRHVRSRPQKRAGASPVCHHEDLRSAEGLENTQQQCTVVPRARREGLPRGTSVSGHIQGQDRETCLRQRSPQLCVRRARPVCTDARQADHEPPISLSAAPHAELRRGRLPNKLSVRLHQPDEGRVQQNLFLCCQSHTSSSKGATDTVRVLK